MEEKEKEAKNRKAVQCVTDPDSGLFAKRENKRQFAYEVYTACDDNGIIEDAVVKKTIERLFAQIDGFLMISEWFQK